MFRTPLVGIRSDWRGSKRRLVKLVEEHDANHDALSQHQRSYRSVIPPMTGEDESRSNHDRSQASASRQHYRDESRERTQFLPYRQTPDNTADDREDHA